MDRTAAGALKEMRGALAVVGIRARHSGDGVSGGAVTDRTSSGRMRLAAVVRLWIASICVLPGGLARVPEAEAQDPSPRAKVESLDLDTAEVGRVTVYFRPADREHAEGLAALTEEAASYFEHAFSASFPLHLAVLTPEDWFDPYSNGEPTVYGSPWGWVQELLMVAPASLEEGVLIRGPDDDANLRRVQYVTLHEFGHLANKRYLHPESSRPYSSIVWFEEFLASYFAYAFIHDRYPERAEAGRREWADVIQSYTPPVLSLERGFTAILPPEEAGRTFGWYQNLLNLRAATVYQEHGLEFLRHVRDRMAWEEAGNWSTSSVLSTLESFASGFETWAENVRSGDVRPPDPN